MVGFGCWWSGLAPLCCRNQPRARFLPPLLPPHEGQARRGGLGLPVDRSSELRPGQLDSTLGCATPALTRTGRTGRPFRHGAKMAFKDPTTWPEPTKEHTEQDEQYGTVRVRAWSGLHAVARDHPTKGTLGRGTVILVGVSRLPGWTRKPQSLWLFYYGPTAPTCPSFGGPTSTGSTWSTPSASSSRR